MTQYVLLFDVRFASYLHVRLIIMNHRSWVQEELTSGLRGLLMFQLHLTPHDLC